MAKLEIPIKVDLDEIDKLIDELRHLQTYKLYEGADQRLVDLDEVVKIIAGHVKVGGEQSTIYPERKKGKWINVNDGKWNTIEVLKCSVCGEMDNRMNKTDNFCPNCGVDMRGEENGKNG